MREVTSADKFVRLSVSILPKLEWLAKRLCFCLGVRILLKNNFYTHRNFYHDDTEEVKVYEN